MHQVRRLPRNLSLFAQTFNKIQDDILVETCSSVYNEANYTIVSEVYETP